MVLGVQAQHHNQHLLEAHHHVFPVGDGAYPYLPKETHGVPDGRRRLATEGVVPFLCSLSLCRRGICLESSQQVHQESCHGADIVISAQFQLRDAGEKHMEDGLKIVYDLQKLYICYCIKIEETN